MGEAEAPKRRLLEPSVTAAVVVGAHDWNDAGLGRAPSFLRSAKGVLSYLIDSAGLNLDPALVLDLFDDTSSAGEQLARIRDTLDVLLRERREEGRKVADILIYYVGHGHTDDQNHLSLLVRRSRRGMEAETGIKAPDLARVLKVAAPQQRRLIVLDCCFSEAAAKDFVGQSGALDQAVAATAVKDLTHDQPKRGTLLLCSSPMGEVSMGPPNAARTLFTGAVLDVLRQGAEGKPAALSFADLRDAAYHRMVVGFGANAPRPVLHQVNAAHGDLTRVPAFPNRASITVGEPAPEKTPSVASAEPGPSRTDPEPPGPTPLRVRVVSRQPVEPAPRLDGALSPHRSQGKRWGLWIGFVAGAATLVWLVLSLPNWGPPSTSSLPMAGVTEPAAQARPTAHGVTAAETSGAPSKSAEATFALGVQRAREGNASEAARFFRLAADQGNADAQTNLGVYYGLGRGGLRKDEREAARLFRLAADQGNANAQMNLGLYYSQGRGGLEKDEREATRLYRLAADQGNADAQTNLGFNYERGLGGLKKDEREAARLYRLAADQANAYAQGNLGLYYENGRGGLEKDESEAARLFRLAADQGNAGAQNTLGIYYEDGRGGLKKDEREAARLFRLAADQGNAHAQANLGLYYFQGRGGLERNEGEAARLFRLAADQGNAYAQGRLGLFYEQGRAGVPENIDKATQLYQQAARAGDEWAQTQLKRLGKTW